MIYLILSIISSTGIFVLFKLFERYKIENLQAIIVNYVVAAGFGFLIYEGEYSVSTITHSGWFTNSIIVGVAFIIAFNFFALSTQKVGVSITAVASKMSVVIPVLFGVFLFQDAMNFLKVSGILIALLAFYLTFKKNVQLRVHKRFLVLPVIIFISNGTVDTLLKFTEHHHITDDLILFLSMVFLVALIVGLAVFVGSSFIAKTSFKTKHLVGGLFLGILNFSSTYYFLKALGTFQVSVVIPILNVGIVSLSALTALFFFKEKLTLINWIGVSLAIAAIVMITYS
jgi:uncharacterized membrane protein